MQGCDPFANDGITDQAEINTKGYFYITERASNSVMMLDYNMREIKRWSLNKIAPDASVQAITFDGRYLWLSFAGKVDTIMQVNAESDSLIVLRALDAPPTRQGTVRGIAFENQYLWALNSGSESNDFPPALYKLDASTGVILQIITLNTPDPRGLCYMDPKPDVYGRGAVKGLYYTDIASDKVYLYSLEKFQLDSAFSSPKPPMGVYNIYPTGISTDGKNFFLVNSSDAADHLYRLDYSGKELSRYDFNYQYPQSVIWTTYDVRDGGPPAIVNISPAKGVKGTAFALDISGSGFKPGITVDFGINIKTDTVSYVNPNLLHLYITIDTAALTGMRTISVTNPNGVKASFTNGFEVTAAPVEEFIYMGESNLSRIYKIRIKDSTVVQYWNTKSISAGSVQGVGFDGTSFWLSASGSDKSLYKLNLPDTDTNATASHSFRAPYWGSTTLRGICFNSGYLWQVVSEPTASYGKIYRIDPVSGSILDSINAPGNEPRGIVWANGKLYCNDTNLDSLYEYSITSQAWKSVCSTPIVSGGSKFSTGLTHDGANFWIATSSGSNDHLFKITVSGQILNILDTRRAGAASDPGITGIIYVAR